MNLRSLTIIFGVGESDWHGDQPDPSLSPRSPLVGLSSPFAAWAMEFQPLIAIFRESPTRRGQDDRLPV